MEIKNARGNLCMPIVLITSNYEGVANVMTAAWSAPTSFEPPLINISVGITRFSHDLILKSGEFAINVLADDQMELAVFCGNVSGRETNKFEEQNISIRNAKLIDVPLINDCAANIECKVREKFLTGDHTVFAGESITYEEDISKNPLIRFRGLFYQISAALGEDDHPAQV